MNILQLQSQVSEKAVIEETLDPIIIHIWTKKRNGRKYWTTIEGLEQTETDIEKLCKKIKNQISCGGSIQEDPKTSNKVIQLQGNHKDIVKAILLKEKLVEEENIKFHGS